MFLTGSFFHHVSIMSWTASVGLKAIFLLDFVDMISVSKRDKAELAMRVLKTLRRDDLALERM